VAFSAPTHATVALAVPIRSQSQTVGFLVGELDRQHLSQILTPALDVGESDYNVELLDDTGQVIAHLGPVNASSPSMHWPLVQPFLSAGQSGVRFHNCRSTARTTATSSPLPR
jgi:hypothetical protein